LPDGVPIFVDSPMALNALRVYRAAIERGDPDVRTEVSGGTDPFSVPGLHEVIDVEGSKALNNPAQPSIIISASGMATGGRVVHHLAHLLPQPANTILLVGFQAEGTRGRRLLEGARELKMLGRYVRVGASVVDLPNFSVHADGTELLAWVASATRPPDTVYVVHGEPAASRTLAAAISGTLGWKAVVPHHGEVVRLDALD
jgi:metallo-beta-lactamase family protein